MIDFFFFLSYHTVFRFYIIVLRFGRPAMTGRCYAARMTYCHWIRTKCGSYWHRRDFAMSHFSMWSDLRNMFPFGPSSARGAQYVDKTRVWNHSLWNSKTKNTGKTHTQKRRVKNIFLVEDWLTLGPVTWTSGRGPEWKKNMLNWILARWGIGRYHRQKLDFFHRHRHTHFWRQDSNRKIKKNKNIYIYIPIYIYILWLHPEANRQNKIKWDTFPLWKKRKRVYIKKPV